MSKGRQYRERLQYQLRFFADRRKFKTRDDAEEAIKQTRAHFLDTGRSIPGVRIEARWRNPDNRNPRHADWKSTTDSGQSLMEFWKTLGRGRGALR